MDDEVVGAAEASEILGVELQRISRWRKTGKLPPPYADLASSPVWLKTDVQELAASFAAPESVPVTFNSSPIDMLRAQHDAAVEAWKKSPLFKAVIKAEAALQAAILDQPLLGTREVANRLGVDKSQVGRWLAQPTKSGPPFPEPAHRIKAGPLWDRADIESYAALRTEKPLAVADSAKH